MEEYRSFIDEHGLEVVELSDEEAQELDKEIEALIDAFLLAKTEEKEEEEEIEGVAARGTERLQEDDQQLTKSDSSRKEKEIGGLYSGKEARAERRQLAHELTQEALQSKWRKDDEKAYEDKKREIDSQEENRAQKRKDVEKKQEGDKDYRKEDVEEAKVAKEAAIEQLSKQERATAYKKNVTQKD